MKLFNWIKNQVRINRAGSLAGDKVDLENIKNGNRPNPEERKLAVRIAKQEERLKIASENNSKSPAKTKTYNIDNSKNIKASINNGVNIDKSKKK